MKLEDVLLTNSEVEDEVAGDDWLDDMKWVCKAQCLKLLDVLKANMNRREVGGVYPEWALSDKFICELEKLLKEDSNG